MESHVLNSYHAARYQIHGHGSMGSTRESCSSESSSYNQNSPDYKYADQNRYANDDGDRDSNDDDEWDGSIQNNQHVTQTEQITSNKSESGVEDNALVFEDEMYQTHSLHNFVVNSEGDIDECDYEIEIETSQPSPHNETPIIYVFAVDPESDLEYSSSEEDWHIQEAGNNEAIADSIENNTENDIQLVTPAIQNENTDHGEEKPKDDKLDLSFEMSAVINVDDFFIKQTKDVKPINLFPDSSADENVVSNVDEYFIQPDKNIKDSNKDILLINNISVSTTANFEDKKTSTAIQTPIEATPTIENYRLPQSIKQEPLSTNEEGENFETAPEIWSANARIDRIKKFLMDDFPGVKSNSKTIQKSCSLPHSPAHISYLDIDDGRTSFSFEDLNINDLPELNFEEDIVVRNPLTTVTNHDNKDDSPRTLTDEDVNEFLITNKTKTDIVSNNHSDSKYIDELSQIDINLKAPIISVIDYSSITTGIPLDKPIGQSKSYPSDAKNSILKNITTNMTTINPNSLKVSTKKYTTPIKCESTNNLNKNTVTMKVEPSKFVKKDNISVKVEYNTDSKVDEDYVDVESYNDTSTIPVLEANNLSSLLEQFEATEKLNNSESKITRKGNFRACDSAQKIKVSSGLTNGTRLQDAAMQLNKNKIRQILISTAPPKGTVPKKSDITVHSDHDYCSPKKRRSTISNIKKGQSLLKPEVLSSNNRILKSRHRTCKNKKVVYHLSSEDETESGVNDNKTKVSVNLSAKTPLQSNHRKKLSPVYSGPYSSVKYENENSVIPRTDFIVSDKSSQVSSGSIKLTIKNKSKVILNLDCDLKKDSLKQISKNEIKKRKGISNKIVDKNKKNIINKTAASNCAQELKNINSDTKLTVNEETRPVKQESKDFYVNLFDNKQDLKISFDTTVPKNDKTKKDPEHVPQQTSIENKKPTKKKLNLQEYKLRKEGVSSASNSRTVSPEAIFPDIPIVNVVKNVQTRKQDFTIVTSSVECKATVPGLSTIKSEPIDIVVNNIAQKTELEPPRKIFDPIREASRKILMHKQKAEAMRKRDEDIVMSKIPKIENYIPQPLAEILNIPEPISEVVLPIPATMVSPKMLDLEEIIMVSVGVNTDSEIFKHLEPKNIDLKLQTKDCNKALINFKIKKPDNVIKQNVFETLKQDKKISQLDGTIKKRLSPNNCKELKIDKERYKNITQALKHVERNVEVKISSNSLFASIQDVVKKSKLDEINVKTVHLTEETTKKDYLNINNTNKNLPLKVSIVRDYDSSMEHGEDKVILHLDKSRVKPTTNSVIIQTDQLKVKIDPNEQNQNITSCLTEHQSEVSKIKKRRESDMSLASECSPTREVNNDGVENNEIINNLNEKVAQVVTHQVKVERSRRDSRRKSSERRYVDNSYRRGSHSKKRISKGSRKSCSRSRSRYRSRSPDRYRRYRRSDSPYRRKRSPCRSMSRREFKRSRRSSYKGRHRTKSRSKSRTRFSQRMSRSPILTKVKSSPSHIELKPEMAKKIGKEGSPPKIDNSMTPPLRKPTISECSESSTSSSSSSASSSSASSSSTSSSDRSSVKRRYSLSPDNTRKKCDLGERKKVSDRSYSSDGRDTGALVEERRIVFVGKLEKETSKSVLRSKFSQFGPIMEVTIHTKEDGTRYGFVTFVRPRDAWSAVEAAPTTHPSYDVGFGGRRAFCRQSYADLDGLEAEYSECGYPSDPGSITTNREDMSFEQMLLDVKKKLSQLKQEKKIEEAKVNKSEP